MRFLSLLRTLFGSSIKQRPDPEFARLPEQEEPLSRFLFSTKSHFSIEKKLVKSGAFLPEPTTLETSVFRTTGLLSSEIWAIGERHVAKPSGRTLRARAELLAKSVYSVALNIHPDNNPERHATIVGWPTEKNEQLMLAAQLAAESALNLRT